MTLPIEVVDRLFQRMAGAYMAGWDRALGNAPLNDVKSTWAAELAEFGRTPQSLRRIAWGLENLPDRPPSAPEFKRLCRQAPMPDEPRIEAPRADPGRVAAELTKLEPIRAARGASSSGVDHRAWARAIVARHEAGERLNGFTLRCAKEALRMSTSKEIPA